MNKSLTVVRVEARLLDRAGNLPTRERSRNASLRRKRSPATKSAFARAHDNETDDSTKRDGLL
jgi:hypothetical protein